jgi:hypothetical protein
MENTHNTNGEKITGPIKYLKKKSFSFSPSAYFPYANMLSVEKKVE